MVFFMQSRVNIFSQHMADALEFTPGLLQGHIGIYAQSKCFSFAPKAVIKSEIFSRFANKKIHSLPVREFIRLIFGLGVFDGGYGKRHGGISPGRLIPSETITSWEAALDME